MKDKSDNKGRIIAFDALTKSGFPNYTMSAIFVIGLPVLSYIFGDRLSNEFFKEISRAGTVISIFVGLASLAAPLLVRQISEWASCHEDAVRMAAVNVHGEAIKTIDELNARASGAIAEAGTRVLSEVRGLIHTLDLASPLKEADIDKMVSLLLKDDVAESAIIALDWNAPSSWQSKSMFDYLAIQSHWMRLKGDSGSRKVTRIFFWDEVDPLAVRTLLTHAALGIECYIAYRQNAVNFLEGRHASALRDALIWDPHKDDLTKALGFHSQIRAGRLYQPDSENQGVDVDRIYDLDERRQIIKMVNDLACGESCGRESDIKICGKQKHQMIRIPGTILRNNMSISEIGWRVSKLFKDPKFQEVPDGIQISQAQNDDRASRPRNGQLCPTAG